MPTSRATAVWEGTLKGGKGQFRAASGTFGGAYTFLTRFEGAQGATPEELIAAAHASCLSMALSADLERAGTVATRIVTEAACTIEIVERAPKITMIALTVRGTVPGLDAAAFQKAAESAKDNCPVSKALRGNVQLRLEAKLES
ncbi:MAG: OsmC family peroxiredoxin [Candidatus Methylomirabilaceae bacterium]